MITKIKAIIKNNLTVSKALSLLYNFGSYWKPPITDINRLMNKTLQNNKSVFFMQIGANDGVSGCDHIRQSVIRNGWKGILVEPVPHIFKKLVKNYEGWPGLYFENAAIGVQDGFAEFYHFDEGMSSWHNELGSFKKEILYRHGIENPDNLIRSAQVPVLTITSLLKKYDVQQLDLLNIDTEGYDYEILKTIDFDKTKPAIIVYEHRHLTEKDYNASIHLLQTHNYSLFSEHESDTIAILKQRKLKNNIAF